MHTALQVQAQVHLSRANGLQPTRRSRRKVEGYDITITQSLFDRCLRPQLVVQVIQANKNALAIYLLTEELNLGRFQSRHDGG